MSAPERRVAPLPSLVAELRQFHQLILKRKEFDSEEDFSYAPKMPRSSSAAAAAADAASDADADADILLCTSTDADDPRILWNSSLSCFSSTCYPSSSASVAAPNSSSASPCPFPAIRRQLQFFIRSMCLGRTLVVRADPEDTVDCVLARFSRATGVSASELRLIYRGRQLMGDATLLDSAVDNDVTLHLTSRLRSTSHPRAWQIANELISEICFFDSAESFCDFASRAHDRRSVESLIKQFLATTKKDCRDNVEQIAAYIQVFTISGAPTALVKLYLSMVFDNRAIAERAISVFLTTNQEFYPESVYLCCAPILLQFCQMMGATVGKEDTLYCRCRSTLAVIMKISGPIFYSFHPSPSHVLAELHCFITELVGAVEAALSSPPLYGPLNLSTLMVDLSNFLTVARQAVQLWSGENGPIGRQHYDIKDAMYEDPIASFYKLFMKLLDKVDQCLEKVDEDHKWHQQQQQQQYDFEVSSKGKHLLAVLTVARTFSKIFGDGEQLLHSLLYKRRNSMNILLRRAKSNPKFRWFLKYKDVTDFQSRRNLVFMMFPEVKEEDELYEMLIDRSQLLSESFEYIGHVDAASLHGGIFMEFKNEEATGPGVVREWFLLLCRAIFDPQNALFMQCPNDYRRFFPNPASSVNPLHLKYFRFSGRVIALALLHKVQVGVTLDRGFFLQLAGKSVSLEDIRDADPMFYMSCKHIMELDAALVDSDALGLTFSREVEVMGSKKTVELQPGGKDITVNSRNREEYINLLINDCFVTSISEQVRYFAQGFGDILSKSKNKQFFFQSLDLEDLDRILSGSSSAINVKEWRAHTEYNGFKATDYRVRWFWEIVEAMSEEQQRVLLFFWTSVKYLPVDGFGGLPSKLYIYRSSDSRASLPTSHTCFYRLCLPAYHTRSMMHQHLQLITQEHIGCSFGSW